MKITVLIFLFTVVQNSLLQLEHSVMPSRSRSRGRKRVDHQAPSVSGNLKKNDQHTEKPSNIPGKYKLSLISSLLANEYSDSSFYFQNFQGCSLVVSLCRLVCLEPGQIF